MILPLSFIGAGSVSLRWMGVFNLFCVHKVSFTVLQASQSIGQWPCTYGAQRLIGRQTHEGVASAMCWVLCTLRGQVCHLHPSPGSLVETQGHNLDTQSMHLCGSWLLCKLQLNPKLNFNTKLLCHILWPSWEMNTCTGHDVSTELHSFNSSIHSLIFTIIIHSTSLSTLESSSRPLCQSEMRNRDHQWLLIKQNSGGDLCYLQGEKDTVTFYFTSPSTVLGTNWNFCKCWIRAYRHQ